MGVSWRTRKLWIENPKEQGSWNLIISICGILIATIINVATCGVFWNEAYIAVSVLLLAWGVVMLIVGLILGRQKAKNENSVVE